MRKRDILLYIVYVSMGFLLVLGVVRAWTNPTLAPPGGGPGPIPLSLGGTGAINSAGARSNLGAAASGINSDIISISGLTTPLSVAQGGTGAANLSGLLLGNGTGSFTALVGSTANDVPTWSGTNWISQAPTGGASSSIVFSNGSDGDMIIASNTPLSRDMYYNSLTVNSGATLSTAGYRVLVKNTLTNNGVIANNGGAGGSLAAGGAGGSGGCQSSGGGGGCGGGCGGVGGAGASKNPSMGSAGGGGGNGSGCSNAGAGGSVTNEQVLVIKQNIPVTNGLTEGAETNISNLVDLSYLLLSGATSGITGSASAGGGGGGGGSGYDGGSGGGGGTGGGIIFISAQTLANNGTIQARGGNGGGGNCGYVGVFAGGGGGGGGGGGAVTLFYKTLSSLGTIDVAGGAGGPSANSSCGGSPAGTAGTVGKIYRAKITF